MMGVMTNREDAVRAAAMILRNSCASDGCSSEDTLTSIAEAIVVAIEGVNGGATVKAAVLASWPMGDFERRREFGESG